MSAPLVCVSRGAQSYLDSLNLTRFDDAFVASRYEVTALTGRAGGGFLLDTNGLHRAQLVGERARTVIQLDFHPHGKIPTLASHPAWAHLPCPVVKADSEEAEGRRTATRQSWAAGRRGFKLYPPDRRR